MIKGAKRLHSVEEYYFSKKLKEVNLLKESGIPIINLGIGSPDLQPPQKAVTALKESLDFPNAHQYQSYRGLPELREAMARFYKDHFKVHLSAKTEVLPLIGSKEGIMHISMAFLDEGDRVLVPDPGYPTYQAAAKLTGAVPVCYDLNEGNGWMPDIVSLEKEDLSRVRMMWINYPHMPTGVDASYKLFEDLIAFGKRHDILIANDNPYSFILNDSPRSILSVPGAKEVCLELNSLSKTFNMAGWRVGMVMGNSHFIDLILKVKSNMDSGMFYGIQKGAIEALNCSELWYMSLRSVYEQRRTLIRQLITKLNCQYNEDTSGMFVWAKLPEYFKSEEFVEVVLKNFHVFIAPGHVFGKNGEGYIRFSLCASTEDIEEALARIK